MLLPESTSNIFKGPLLVEILSSVLISISKFKLLKGLNWQLIMWALSNKKIVNCEPEIGFVRIGLSTGRLQILVTQNLRCGGETLKYFIK
jgi:hypothetical protein